MELGHPGLNKAPQVYILIFFMELRAISLVFLMLLLLDLEGAVGSTTTQVVLRLAVGSGLHLYRLTLSW